MSQGNQTCPVCGTDNEPEALFCAECGTRLQPTLDQNPPSEAVDTPTAASSWPPPATDTTPGSSLASEVPPAVPTTTGPENPPAAAPPAPPTSPVGPMPPAPPTLGATRPTGAPTTDPPVPVGRRIGEPTEGNWLTGAPPTTVIVVGVILSLGSCLIVTMGQDALREPIEPLLICAVPIGLLLLLVGLVRLIARQRRHS